MNVNIKLTKTELNDSIDAVCYEEDILTIVETMPTCCINKKKVEERHRKLDNLYEKLENYRQEISHE